MMSQKALDRLNVAVSDNEHLICLTQLGVSLRICETLERNGFYSLESVLMATKDELLSIKQLDEKSVNKVISAISRFHELDEVAA